MYSFLLEGEQTATTPWLMIILLVVMVGFFIFSSRMNKKQDREAAQMRDSLEVGDEITTIGGIVGEIVSIKDETITIETSKAGTKIRFLKTAVRSVDVHAADKYAPAEDAAPADGNTPAEKKKN